jgi:hypothetical protein
MRELNKPERQRHMCGNSRARRYADFTGLSASRALTWLRFSKRSRIEPRCYLRRRVLSLRTHESDPDKSFAPAAWERGGMGIEIERVQQVKDRLHNNFGQPSCRGPRKGGVPSGSSRGTDGITVLGHVLQAAAHSAASLCAEHV